MRRSGAWVSHGRSSNWSPITGKSESSSEYVKQRHDGRSTHCRTHLSLLTWRWVCQLIYQYQSVIFVVYSPTSITPLSSVWCFFFKISQEERVLEAKIICLLWKKVWKIFWSHMAGYGSWLCRPKVWDLHYRLICVWMPDGIFVFIGLTPKVCISIWSNLEVLRSGSMCLERMEVDIRSFYVHILFSSFCVCLFWLLI